MMVVLTTLQPKQRDKAVWAKVHNNFANIPNYFLTLVLI